jgi:hypothetical protein
VNFLRAQDGGKGKVDLVDLAAEDYSPAGFRIPGIMLRVQGLGFRVQGVGFRVQGLGFSIQDLGFRIQGIEAEVQGVSGSGFKDWSSGFIIASLVKSFGLRVEVLRIEDLKFVQCGSSPHPNLSIPASRFYQRRKNATLERAFNIRIYSQNFQCVFCHCEPISGVLADHLETRLQSNYVPVH